MSVEDVKVTGRIRDRIVSRLETHERDAYRSASVKAWRSSMKGEAPVYSEQELRAIELVEQQFLFVITHSRKKAIREYASRWVSR